MNRYDSDINMYLLNLVKNVMIPEDYPLCVQHWLPDGRSSSWIEYDYHDPPQEFQYRERLPNELIFEVDVDKDIDGSWQVTRYWIINLIEAIEKLDDRSPVTIPWYLYASSGKGLHLHIFLEWVEIGRSRETKDIRISCMNKILSYMDGRGLDVSMGGVLDTSCIVKSRQLIKIEGMYNSKTTWRKTLLAQHGCKDIHKAIPLKREDCYLAIKPLPMKIERWIVPFHYY